MQGDRFGKRLLVASGVLAVLLALILGAMLFAIRDLRDAGRNAREAQATIAASSALQTLLLNIETSARGRSAALPRPPGSQPGGRGARGRDIRDDRSGARETPLIFP